MGGLGVDGCGGGWVGVGVCVGWQVQGVGVCRSVGVGWVDVAVGRCRGGWMGVGR